MKSSRKILFVLTSHGHKGDKPSGFWLGEMTHPYAVLSQAGYSIDFVSPKGGKPPIDPDSFDLNDPINAAFWNNETLRAAVERTMEPRDVNIDDYAAIFFAGGHGVMWDLPSHTELARITAAIYDRGDIVGAVCHGPAALVNVRLTNGDYLVAGRDVSAFTNEEEREVKLDKVIPFSLEDILRERGARHQGAPPWQTKVIVSERLVTGQNPASAAGVGEAMAKLLRGG